MYVYQQISIMSLSEASIYRHKFSSGRGGARANSGRPKLVTPSTKVVRVPFDVDVQLALDCYYAVCDCYDNQTQSPRHEALNKFIANLIGQSTKDETSHL